MEGQNEIRRDEATAPIAGNLQDFSAKIEAERVEKMKEEEKAKAEAALQDQKGIRLSDLIKEALAPREVKEKTSEEQKMYVADYLFKAMKSTDEMATGEKINDADCLESIKKIKEALSREIKRLL